MQQDWAPPPGLRPHLHPLHPAAAESPNIPDLRDLGMSQSPSLLSYISDIENDEALWSGEQQF